MLYEESIHIDHPAFRDAGHKAESDKPVAITPNSPDPHVVLQNALRIYQKENVASNHKPDPIKDATRTMQTQLPQK